MTTPRFSWALYASLILLRLYLALQPSYIHPDELFQGADAVTADLFHAGKSSTLSWEFTSQRPVRSIAPLYIFLSPALYLLRAFKPAASPQQIFATLRLQQFGLSLGIDALIYLLSNARRTRQHKTLANVILFASSYTAWTYHTHTFSNSWETWLVLLALYLHLYQHGYMAQLLRGVILALGAFTRVSFVSFLAPIYLLSLGQRAALASSIISLTAAIATATVFVLADSAYYQNTTPLPIPAVLTSWPGAAACQAILSKLVLTPVNNLLYNADSANLAKHGLHPRWTHLLNLVILLGPALTLLPGRLPTRSATLLVSAVAGFVSLSLVPHQEARFLLPVTALLLTALDLDPQNEVVAEEIVVTEVETALEKDILVTDTQIVAPTRRISRRFIASWIVFNALAGGLFGLLHQRGVISASLDIARMQQSAGSTLYEPGHTAVQRTVTRSINASNPPKVTESTPVVNKSKTLVPANEIQVAYYKTYPAPAYLLPPGVTVKHLQGCSEHCTNPGAALNRDSLEGASFLVVPLAFFDDCIGNMTEARRATAKFLTSTFVEVGRYPHVDLDNLDLTVLPTWQRYRQSLQTWTSGRKEPAPSRSEKQEKRPVKPEAKQPKQASTPVMPAERITPDVSTADPVPASPVPEVSVTPGPKETAMPDIAWTTWLYKRVVEGEPSNPVTTGQTWLEPVWLTEQFVRDAAQAQSLVLLKRRHPVKSVREGGADAAGAVRRRVPDADWRMM
ncbi:Alg9-like mannosyltransferase family-domain-containing protein [Protomyces lactucae-debilis]|uniref:Mannosyltransferase n=1 Tax=Protomyces lactucae-debilis TaxID=2754530 RepID=A0A1Y2FII2_PROLT|nr:Alg9-like mannosyltransferase family-domain-containing protein [Protomyces lactucae-debilis]ORY83194.1 Alg9-like mannosyltransferase family-domain-containing protein [Protomyces lactucae-debilis]